MWQSMTGKFGAQEMNWLQTLSSGTLANMLLSSSPIVALRALTEIRLHQDVSTLSDLLRNDQMNLHWRQCIQNLEEPDAEYARALEKEIKNFQQEGDKL